LEAANFFRGGIVTDKRIQLTIAITDGTTVMRVWYTKVKTLKFSTSSTRGHPLKLYYSDSRINARAHSFPVRIVMLWNRLPAATVLSGSLQSFKKSIEGINFNYALHGKFI